MKGRAKIMDAKALELRSLLDQAVALAAEMHKIDGTAVMVQGSQIGTVHNLHLGVKLNIHNSRVL